MVRVDPSAARVAVGPGFRLSCNDTAPGDFTTTSAWRSRVSWCRRRYLTVRRWILQSGVTPVAGSRRCPARSGSSAAARQRALAGSGPRGSGQAGLHPERRQQKLVARPGARAILGARYRLPSNETNSTYGRIDSPSAPSGKESPPKVTCSPRYSAEPDTCRRCDETAPLSGRPAAVSLFGLGWRCLRRSSVGRTGR